MAANFTFTFLTLPGPSLNGVVFGIDHGVVFGVSDNSNIGAGFVNEGFTFSNGVYTLLIPPGATGAIVRGVNASGEAVGNYDLFGFSYSNGAYTQIAAPGSTQTIATGVDNAGDVVGIYVDNTIGHTHGFIDINGAITTIDPAGTNGTTITGITGGGEAFGSYTDANGVSHGFTYDNGNYATIDPPDSAGTHIGGVNAAGEVVGTYTDSNGNSHGFIDIADVYTTLDVPGATSTSVTGIDASGDVVGTYNGSDGVSHGFSYDFVNNVYTTLDVPGASSTALSAVDPDGQGIVARAHFGSLGEWFVGTVPLFTASADSVNFNALSARQQSLIANGADIYHGLGGNDVVTLPSLANYNESVGSTTLGWTSTPASTFFTGSQPGDSDQVIGSNGNYYIVAGAGSDTINITGNGNNTISAGSGSDTITITGNGANVVNAGSGTATVSVSGSGTISVSGNLNGSVSIAGSETLELGAGFTGTVTFGGNAGKLILDQPQLFQGTIKGLVAGDSIELADTKTADVYASIGGTPDNSNNKPVQNLHLLVAADNYPDLNYPVQAASGDFNGDFFQPTKTLNGTQLTLTEGSPIDLVVNGPTARNNFGVNGSGITVGIISDSFNNRGGSRPTNVTDLYDGLNGRDEGAAMAAIVDAIAPGVKIDFYAAGPNINNSLTPQTTADTFATAVTALQQAGCQIIVDDIGLHTRNDSVLISAVDAAVQAGVAYISAAGNWDGYIYGQPADPNVIAVGAMDWLGAPKPPASAGGYLTAETEKFSDKGRDDSKPDLTGPDDWNHLRGTSYAAPVVAAVAALMLQANGQLTPLAVRQLLQASAAPFGQPPNQMGAGLVQADAALALAAGSQQNFYTAANSQNGTSATAAQQSQPAADTGNAQAGPSVTSASLSQPAGDAHTGLTLRITVDLNEGVTVTGGAPALTLNSGGTAVFDAGASDPSAGTLTFDYTVGSGDSASNLEVTGLAPGVTIQDAQGNNADFSAIFNLGTGLSINSPLQVTSVSSPQSGEVPAGQPVQLIIAMNEAVTVDTTGGPPTLILNDGATATYNANASNLAAGLLAFDYTVGANDETPDQSVFEVDLPTGTTVQDASGNNADFSAALNQNTGIQIGPAFVTAVTPSQNAVVGGGQTVTLTIAPSGPVTVSANGSPTLTLNDGAIATYDANSSTPSTGLLVFDYAVGANDQTPDLEILQVNPNGATIEDANGYNVDFSGAVNVPTGLWIGQDATVGAEQGSEGIVVPSGGTLDVLSGGTDIDTTVTMGGIEVVEGEADNSALEGGSESVQSGGIANYTLVDSGTETVASGGTVANARVNSGGTIYVTSGGTALETTINGGTLELADGAFADEASFALGSSGGMLWIDGTSMPTSEIDGYVAGDTIDLRDVGFDSAGTALVSAGNVLQIIENGKVYDLQLDPDGDYSQAHFSLTPDGQGGTDVTEAAPRVGAVPYDFNGDGTSDLLFQNTNATPQIWLMNGTSVISQTSLPDPPVQWRIVGSGDFNGDGNGDILWLNTISNQPAVWEMNGTSIISAVGLPAPPPSWRIAGIGDVNGDGNADIIWQNSDGQPSIWEMNGTSVISAVGLATPSPQWRIVATGDFNGDGNSDLLWINTVSNQASIWEMNGTSVISAVGLSAPPSQWEIVGTGDFNGDGDADIVWLNTVSNQASMWEMNGTSVISAVGLPAPPPGWRLVGTSTSDVNGDGMSDLLWQNTNDGTVTVWEMNGTSIAVNTPVGTPGATWLLNNNDPPLPSATPPGASGTANGNGNGGTMHMSMPDAVNGNSASGATNGTWRTGGFAAQWPGGQPMLGAGAPGAGPPTLSGVGAFGSQCSGLLWPGTSASGPVTGAGGLGGSSSLPIAGSTTTVASGIQLTMGRG
jgi:autotransporter passenger strand-loop-strand repeat protein